MVSCLPGELEVLHTGGEYADGLWLVFFLSSPGPHTSRSAPCCVSGRKQSLLKVLLLQPSLLGQFSALLATSSMFQVSVKIRLVIFNFLPACQLTFRIN